MWGICQCQPDPTYYGISLAVGPVMAVSSRVVLGMEGTTEECMDHLRVRHNADSSVETQDIGQVLSALDSDSRSMERGLASWHPASQRMSCCFISTVAGWCTSIVYTQNFSLTCTCGDRTCTRFAHSFRQPGFGGGPVDHYKGPDSLFSWGRFQARPTGPSSTGFCISDAEG